MNIKQSARLRFWVKKVSFVMFALLLTVAFNSRSSAQTSPSQFKIVAPQAGSTVIQGSVYKILWSGWDYYKNNKVKNYDVYLVGGSLGPTSSRYIGKANFDSQDWVSWTVPTELSGSGFQIQFSGAGATGGNSGSFSIAKSPVINSTTTIPYYIKIASPNGGESYKSGSEVTVKWETNLPKNQRLVLALELGEQHIGKVLGEVKAGDGKYVWKAEYIDSITSTESNPPTTFFSNGQFKMKLYCPAEDSVCIKSGGVNYADDSDSVFTIKNISPVVNSLTPASGKVGTKVKIDGSNFKPTNNMISFVGSTNVVPGSSPDSISPVNGEADYKNVDSLDGKTLSFTIPSKFDSNSGEDGLMHPGAVVIPGNYYVMVQTVDGKSRPVYFRVIGFATGTPPIVSTSTMLNVTQIGTPVLLKSDITRPGAKTPTILYTTSFEMNIANPLNEDVILGLPSSAWPAFGTSAQYVQIYKNGVVDPVANNLTVNYTYPTGGTLSTDGKTFKVLARGVVNVRVTYSFTVNNSGTGLYKVGLSGLGWGTVARPNQILPINMTTTIALGSDSSSETASASKAMDGVLQWLWDGLFGWIK